jgi:hypothetical protein
MVYKAEHCWKSSIVIKSPFDSNVIFVNDVQIRKAVKINVFY